MAAVHSSRQHHHPRRRSASDPFVDPSTQRKNSNPPPLPPKSAQSPRMPNSSSRAAPTSDIADAVRDTVTVRPQENSTRSKVNRSQTAATSQSSRPSGRRSQSEDSGHVTEKPRSNGKSRPKKGSRHADVIDRLDFTGVGPMFHHDGPFDACAPSRNKHRNKAPMFAWGDDPTAAQLSGSAYPPPHAYQAFSNDYPDPPKKKVDAIAEAWGIHEPEPFEDFSAGGGSGRLDNDTPASSIYNGRESHSRTARRPKDIRDPNREFKRQSTVPPPQPIFVGEAQEMESSSGSPPASPGNPKRSKSLMQRIRKMRDAPNVPVGRDYDLPPSPTSPDYSRPTHRPQNSFLGRLAGGSRTNPTSEKPEPFVYIEAQTKENKDLPPAPIPVQDGADTPSSDYENSTGYFDGQTSSSPGRPGLGRKSSLIKKMGRVVRGGGAK